MHLVKELWSIIFTYLKMEDFMNAALVEKSAYKGFVMMLHSREKLKNCIVCGDKQIVHKHSFFENDCGGCGECGMCDISTQTNWACGEDDIEGTSMPCIASNNDRATEVWLVCTNCLLYYLLCPKCDNYCNVISHPGAMVFRNYNYFDSYLKSMAMESMESKMVVNIKNNKPVVKKDLEAHIKYFTYRHYDDHCELTYVVRASKNACYETENEYTFDVRREYNQNCYCCDKFGDKMNCEFRYSLTNNSNDNTNNNDNPDDNMEVNYYYVGDRSDKFINANIWDPTGFDGGIDHVWQCKKCNGPRFHFSDK